MANLTPHQQTIIAALRKRFGNTATRQDLVSYEKDSGTYVRQHWIQDHKVGRGVYDLWLGSKPGIVAVMTTPAPAPKAAVVKTSTRNNVAPKKNTRKQQKNTRKHATPVLAKQAKRTDEPASFTDAANAEGLTSLTGTTRTAPVSRHAGATRVTSKLSGAPALKGSKLRSKGRSIVTQDNIDDGFGYMAELRKEARTLANELGHTLSRFKSRAYTNEVENSYCTDCLQLIVINSAPEYTDMEKIYGRCATTECEGHCETLRGDFGNGTGD